MAEKDSRAALQGIRVIEFGDGITTSYCGALLAACGADVIKIEPPQTGDTVRTLPPIPESSAGAEASGMHAFMNAGKRSVTLALEQGEDAAAATRLVEQADIVIEGLGPGVMDGLGLGYSALAKTNPRLVMASLSWFGADGSRSTWKGTDAVAQALSGFLYPIGPKEGPPIIPGGYNAQITGGLTAYIAITTGLVGRLAGDEGAHIDLSVLEAQLTYTETSGVRAAYDGAVTPRKGLNKFTPTYPQTIYPAAAGWIGVTVLTPAQWRACCDLIGAPELVDDPRFRTSKDRNERADELDPVLVPLFRKRTALEWFHEGQARRVPLALVPTMADMLGLDHFVHRQVLAHYEHPDLGQFTAATIPWKLAGTPLKRGGKAPRLGQHTEEVLADMDMRRPPPQALSDAKAAGLPLRDVRVVDLTMGWSGPLATRHLADMGAEVVKIEACKYPDWWRGWEHSAESLATKEHEKSPSFNQINRNKLGVAIDLTTEDGQALALDLVARADAVIENQATGVMNKLGLSYETLKQVNPEIVMLSLPAFGAEGPWAGYRGYGSTVEHGAGLPHLTGSPDGPPVQTHVAYGDACGGLNAAAALLTALVHRKSTGQGQRLELSQVECIMQLGVHGTITQGLTGRPPDRTGNRHPVYVPHGCFRCEDDDSWVVIAATSDVAWRQLAHAIGRADLAEDQTLSSASSRRAREDELEAAVEAWTRTQTPDAAMTELQACGVAAGAVRRASALASEPALLDRGFWKDVAREVVGVKPHPLTAWRYNAKRAEITRPAPLLGEHNRDVFVDLLGISEDAHQALTDAGVIGDEPYVS